MVFERYYEKNQIPRWSTEDGIPAFTLPMYHSVGVPVEKTNYFIMGQTNSGKTTVTKKIIKKRIEMDVNLRIFCNQIKIHDFDEIIGKNGKYICLNPNVYPHHNFVWNALKEFRLAGEEKWFSAAMFFCKCITSEFHQTAGSNLYFVDTAEELVARYFLSLLYGTKENIGNDKTFGFLDHKSPKEILDIIANYSGNRPFLEKHFGYVLPVPKDYVLNKRGQDVFIFVDKIVRVVTGTFRQNGNDTIIEFLSNQTPYSRLCLVHDEGNPASFVMEQYFLHLVAKMQLGIEDTGLDNLLIVLDEPDKTRIKGFPLSILANLGRQVGNKHTQLILSTQSFNNLYMISEDVNGHDTRSLLTGFPTTIAFNTGMDETTRDLLKGSYGTHRVECVTTPSSRYDRLIREVKDIPWITDEEFASLEKGQAVVKIRSSQPYRVQFVK